MNFKKLLLFVAAPLMLVLAGCQPEPVAPSYADCEVVDAEGNALTSLSFTAEAGSQTFTIKATRSWTITTTADWYGVTPSSMTNTDNTEKSTVVTVTALANDGEARSSSLTITCGDLDPINITVSQADAEGNTTGGSGDGTEASPYSVARALEIINGGQYTTDMVYTAGTISSIKEVDPSYGNATFNISDDGTTTSGQLTIYRCRYLNNAKFTSTDQIKVGDKVVVLGALTLYNTTPEVTQGGYLVKINDLEGTPAPELKEGPYTSDEAFVCKADNSTTATYTLNGLKIGSEDVSGFKLGKGTLEGVFTSGAVGVSGDKYLNFYAAAWKGSTVTLYWSVDGGAVQSQALTANDSISSDLAAMSFAATDHYSIKLTGLTATSKIQFGTNATFANTEYERNAPRAVVCGVKLSDSPIEGVAGGGGSTEPDQPANPDSFAGSGEGTEASPYDVTRASDIIAKGAATSTAVYTKGIISQIDEVSTSFGNATYYISVDGTTTNHLTVFRGKYLNNEKFTAADQIKVGDNVVVLGVLELYNGSKAEITGSQIVSLNAGEGGGTVTPEPEPEPTPGIEIPEGAVVWNIGAANQTWAAETDATLGAGFAATVNNLKVGYYTHKSSNAVVAAKDDHIRVYKTSALVITPLDGRKITQVIMLCTDPYNTSIYTWNMNVSDGTTAVANQDAKYITWSGNTDKFEAYADNGQVRIKTLAVVLDGEGSGTVTPDPTPDPEPEPETPVEFAGTGEGTEASPYDVTRASDIITKGAATSTAVYTKGIISQIDEVNTSFGNATYYISVDGTTTNHLVVFRGKYLNNEKFTAADQIKVGDEVVVLGVLELYNGSKAEITGSQIVSLNAGEGGGTTEPDPTPDPTPGEGDTTDGTTISQDIFANTGALDGKTITWDFDEFTVSNNQHNSSTAIRTTDTDHFRAYQGSLLTFTAKGGKKFSKIVVTCTGSSYATELVNSFGTSVATANGADVTITCDSAEVSAEMLKQVRFKKVAVTLN
ncbi:MAG: BACON domain-containing protein [Tidjanibacter sp.]|nr:BACON domain-containing protein [Tidjanibacter sp.]